jgi:cytochrome c-type biogenesis protein
VTLLLLGSLVAGILTTLAPCVLPLLPVIIGGSLSDSGESARRRAVIIAASLGVSIAAFTLLLRAGTGLLGVPASTWQWLSGGILILLGLIFAVPEVWDRVSQALSLQARAGRGLEAASQRSGTSGAILTGAALGPVFSSCSPFYLYAVVTVLPASLGEGLLLLLGYVVGLSGTLLLIALIGQSFIAKTRWLANPRGWFRRGIGIAFILVGIIVIFGLDRELQAWIIEYSPIRPWELDSGFIPPAE